MSYTTGGRQRRHWAMWAVALALFLAPAAVTQGDNQGKKKKSTRAREVAQGKGSASMQVLVRFRRVPSASERSLVQGLGGKERRKLSSNSRWLSVRVPANRVAALADNGAVDFVTIDEPVMTTMDIPRKAINEPVAPAPESVFKGAGVTVAVVDSGVAVHPDIQTLTAAVDVVANPNAVAAPPETSIDPYGHGTHVAGVIVGGGQGSDGRLAGVAPQASLISVRVLDEAGGGSASDVLAGLQWIQDHRTEYGIRVVNLSLGHVVYESASVDPLVEAVEALWDSGVVVVCSAGNRGRDGHVTITSPCNSRKVITVGAANDRNTPPIVDDRIATFSSRGPTAFDLFAKPDIVAPGNRIVSLRSVGSRMDTDLPDRRVSGNAQNPNAQDYFEMSGTSMASPIVAGTAALMIEKDPSLNPGTIKARMMMSAQKAKFGDPLLSGAGYLDVTEALRSTWVVADAPSPRALPDVATGRIAFENTSTLWGNDAFSLRALWGNTVAWSDPDAYLDPILETDGELWIPNGLPLSDSEIWPTSEVWPLSEMWPDGPAWMPAVTTPQEAGPVQTEALAVGFCDP